MPPTPTPPRLLDLLREHLAQEGGAPSRPKLTLLIEAGAARVDGVVVRDPRHIVTPGARLSFDLDDIHPDGFDPARLKRAPRPAAPAARPPGVLHADLQLVVVERAAFPPGPPTELAAAVAHVLGRERLWPVDDPSAPGSGPVLLAGSDAARKALAAAFDEGRVLETLLSVRTPAQAGPHEVVLERGTPGPGRPASPFALLRREEGPAAAPPLGARQLVAPQRLALALKHPRTNRRLAFEVGASPAFLEALLALGLAGPSD